MSSAQSLGGLARAAKLTALERKNIATKAALARHAKGYQPPQDRIKSLFEQLLRNAEYIRKSAEVLEKTGESYHGEALRVLKREAGKRYKKVEAFAEKHNINLTAK